MMHTVQGKLPSSLSATLNTVSRKSSLQPLLPTLPPSISTPVCQGSPQRQVGEISAGPSGTNTKGTERQPSRWHGYQDFVFLLILITILPKRYPGIFSGVFLNGLYRDMQDKAPRPQNPLIPQIYHNLVKCPRAHIPSRLRNPFPHPSLVTRPETGHSHILFERMEKQRKEQRPVCALQHLSSMPCPFPLPRGLSSSVIKTRGKAQLWPQIKNILLWSTKLV